MRTAVVTGGAGFLGRLLVQRLLDEGWKVLSIDLHPLEFQHENLHAMQGDIRQAEHWDALLRHGPADVIFHCAAQLAHGSIDKNLLWTCNVDGTERVGDAARRHKIGKVVYISSNCLWGESMGRPVTEEDAPKPIELYGKSKLRGEEVLLAQTGDFDTIVIRCPTIIDAGRLGLLAILFEFIDEGRKVWVVGDGSNRYQFIYAQDLITAMMLACGHNSSAVFGIGTDNPGSLKDVYKYVIEKSGSRSRVASLPQGPTVLAMKAAYHLGISPLGPYHYRMIAADFSFDTSRIKAALNWKPTLSNEEILLRSYEFYHRNKQEIASRSGASTHRQASSMGIIRLLKWVS